MLYKGISWEKELELLNNDLMNNILDKKYIFLDFFDTTVHRKCSPISIKEMWAKKLAIELAMSANPCEIYFARHDAEVELEKKDGYSYTYMDLAKLIWNRLYDADKCNLDMNDFAQLSLAIESEIESANIYLDETILSMLNAVDNEKMVYIISDYHMGKEIIDFYLEKLKISQSISGIFVSCDYKKSKYNGDLYEKVLEILNCDVKDCIMIGDNYYSDIKKSTEKQLYGLYRPYKFSFDVQEKEHYISSLKKMHNKDNYSGYCFSLGLFTEKLYIKLKKERASDVYFLSREGEFLKKLFDLFCKINSDHTIRTHYLYVSRQSTFVASLNSDLDNENFEILFRQFKNMSLSTFMKNIGFSEDDIFQIGNIAKKDITVLINDFPQSSEYLEIKQLPEFKSIYCEIVRRQNKLFLDYLKQEGYDQNCPLYLVDVGWKGTIQDNISRALRNSNEVKGYYLGYGELGLSERSIMSKKCGLLFSVVPYMTIRDSCWALDAGMYEKILYASHASTAGYMADKGIKPIFEFYEAEQGVYQAFIPIQNEILKKCEFEFNLFANCRYMLSDFEHELLLLHMKSVLSMNYSKINFRKTVEEKHFENFGTFDTVDVGKVSDKFSIMNNLKYVKNRIKKILDPNYFTINSYHFVKIKNRVFWSAYSAMVFKIAKKKLKGN